MLKRHVKRILSPALNASTVLLGANEGRIDKISEIAPRILKWWRSHDIEGRSHCIMKKNATTKQMKMP